MANNGAKYENQIIQAIQYVVEESIKNATFDKTIQATIISCVDPTIGKYKVRFQDSTFYAFSNNTEVTYSNNSSVYVLIPGNDMSRDKTILGSTKKLGIDYVDNLAKEDSVDIVGTNCIESNTSFELCSYNKEEVITIYDRNNENNNKINLNINSLERYIKQSSSLICGATFKTNLPIEQQMLGKYGIVYELSFADNATGKTVTRNYVIDVNQISGNPYRVFNDTRYYGIFAADGENFLYVNKIYLFQYDFPNVKEGQPTDIFIKNLELFGCNRLTQEELKGSSLTIATPQGAYFDDTDTDKSTRVLQAQVRIKGKVIDNNSQQLEYYWFVENLGVTSNHKLYNQYGGIGWECLNPSIPIQEGDNPIVQWTPASYQFTIKKDDTKAKETRYKCVAIYNSTKLSKEIIITNYSSNFEISIDSSGGTQFYYDIGSTNLTCLVNGEDVSSDDYTFVWAKIDNNNVFTSLSNTDKENAQYKRYLENKEEILEKIKRQGYEFQYDKDSLEMINNELDSFKRITRVDNQYIYNIQINTITSFAIYKCSVYHKGVYIGTSSITLLNTFENQNNYSLIINNGNQVFKYNEAGITPINNTLENPFQIPELTFTLYNNLGEVIDNENIKSEDIVWQLPQENNTLIDTIEISRDNKTLVYNIKKKYDIRKQDNNIKLTVKYKDISITTITNFTFIKEGEPGTNGTEFVCKIVPNTDDIVTNAYVFNGKINYNPKERNKWFKVQLWHNTDKIFENTATGYTEEGIKATVEWSILKNSYDNTDFTIDKNTGEITYNGFDGNNSPSNIIKCVVKYKNINYFATLPIVTARSDNAAITDIKLVDNTGFKYVIYTSDGRNPQYDDTLPFEIRMFEEIETDPSDFLNRTEKVDVTEAKIDKEGLVPKYYYFWYIKGKMYDPIEKEWNHISNLIRLDNKNSFKQNFKPREEFNGEIVNNGIYCSIIDTNGNLYGEIHIPIHLLLNRYGNAAINDWDGNSVSIDENGNGVILAPQIGAGKKEEKDNSFTGMVMGTVKEYGKNYANTGLFGYSYGRQSLFLNSENGSAIFGKAGTGQIILDPRDFDDDGKLVNGKALIYSSNFWDRYIDNGKNIGLPRSYNSSNETGEGMLIDLTTPSIRWRKWFI